MRAGEMVAIVAERMPGLMPHEKNEWAWGNVIVKGRRGGRGGTGKTRTTGTSLGSGHTMNLRHHSLVAWQRADDLFIHVHTLARTFPYFERFELSSQLRRAALSVPSNIVEEFARRHLKERLHFLNISESSLAEVWQCLHSAQRLGYITKEVFEEFESELNGVGAPLTGLVRSTKAEIRVAVGATAVFIAGLMYFLS